MRKLSIILLVVLLISTLAVSCENQPKADTIVSVRFSADGNARSLSETRPILEEVNDNSLTWYYKATKVSSSDFQTGASASWTIIPSDGISEAGKLTNVIPFSQGLWNFELEARKNGKAVYRGSVTDALITSDIEINPIYIDVYPDVEGETGTIKLVEVYIKGNDNSVITPNLVKVDGNEISLTGCTDYQVANNKVTATLGNFSADTHTIIVSYCDALGNVVNASEEKSIRVYSGRETLISNFVEETISGGQFVPAKAGNYETEVSSSTESITIVVENITPSQVQDNHTTVVIPSGIIVPDTSEGAITTARIDVAVKNSTDISDGEYDITTASDASEPVASIDLTLTKIVTVGEDVSETIVSDFVGAPVIVETYIETGLSYVEVKYNGELADPICSNDSATPIAKIWNSDELMGDSLGYSKETGKLRFTVSHFSKYYAFGYAGVEDLETLVRIFGDGGRIILGTDIECNNTQITLPNPNYSDPVPTESKTLYLDFNGHKLNNAVFELGHINQNAPRNNVVIVNSGSSEDYSLYGKLQIHEGGGMTCIAGMSAWQGVTTIKSGKYYHDNAVLHSQLQTSNPTDAFNIEGGTFITDGEGSVIFNEFGTMNISGGEFIGQKYGITMGDGNSNVDSVMNISGGSFTVDNVMFDLNGNVNGSTIYKNIVNITGGDFYWTGAENSEPCFHNRTDDETFGQWAEFNITGGKFHGINPFTGTGIVVPNGYVCTETESNVWEVVQQ